MTMTVSGPIRAAVPATGTAIAPAKPQLIARCPLFQNLPENIWHDLARRCLHCHAPAEALGEGTRSWLRAAYPEDRALGYALGDLRGFWWAEVPKEPASLPAPAGR